MLGRVLLLCSCVSLAGCLLTVDSEGRSVSRVWDEADVARLQVGRSDSGWVRSTFGEPAATLSYGAGREVWKYRNRAEKDIEVGLFLVFSVDVEEERIDTLSIEFEQGVVAGYWIEEDRF